MSRQPEAFEGFQKALKAIGEIKRGGGQRKQAHAQQQHSKADSDKERLVQALLANADDP